MNPDELKGNIQDERQRREEALSRLLRLCGHRLWHASPESRSQAVVLQRLAEGGSVSQKELQEQLLIQPASMTELIGKLACRGLLTRERDPQDLRRMVLTITDAGRAQARHLSEHQSGSVSYASLLDQELEQITGLLEKIIRGWEEESAAGTAGAPGKA